MPRTIPLALLLAALSGPLSAQPKPVPDPVPVPGPAARQGLPVVSLEFRGGSLAKFAAELRAAGAAVGAAVNIVGPAEMSAIAVPPVQLKSVSIRNALEAVATVAAGEFKVDVAELNSEGAASVYAVRVMGPRHLAPQPPRGVRVFSLQNLTKLPPGLRTGSDAVMSPETVLSAIETGLSVAGTDGDAVVRFHADSGLVFVLGSEGQLAMVGQVLSNLTQDVENRRHQARPLPVPAGEPPSGERK